MASTDTPVEPEDLADDANELVQTETPKREWAKAKATAAFPNSRKLTFRAVVQAARSLGCNILILDWANGHLQLAFPTPASPPGTHDLYVFEAVGLGCELDLSSREANIDGRYDECYKALVREAGKFLMFAAEPEPEPISTPISTPIPIRSTFIRRRRRESPSGLVCSILSVIFGSVGLLSSCPAAFAMVLFSVIGLILGLIGTAQSDRKALGVIGIVLSAIGILLCIGIVFLMLVAR
jgi:hypothetical protein